MKSAEKQRAMRSADRDLLVLERHGTAQILTPRAFWDEERAVDR